MKPASVTVGWGELCLDRNWQNQPLRIGNRQFAHGLWAHADSELGYRLGGKYERFEAWIGMDQARPAARRGSRSCPAALKPCPARRAPIAAGYPVQAAWFVEDTGGRQLEWFRRADNTRTEQACIGRVLGQLGGNGREMQQELAQLVQAPTGAADPRWLDLYGRACRLRECLAGVRQVRIRELRMALEKAVRDLAAAKAPADDPRWTALQARLRGARRRHGVAVRVLAGGPAAVDSGVGRGDARAICRQRRIVETPGRAGTARWQALTGRHGAQRRGRLGASPGRPARNPRLPPRDAAGGAGDAGIPGRLRAGGFGAGVGGRVPGPLPGPWPARRFRGWRRRPIARNR